MTRPKRTAWLAAVLLVSLGCDRITKSLAEQHLKGTPTRSYLSDTLRLQYLENQGAFLGLGSSWAPGLRQWVFTFGTGLLLLVVGARLFAAAPASRLGLLGWALFLSGGLGNLWDRLARSGQVIDFLNLGLGPLRTGVFNVADMVIMAGAGLLILQAALVQRLPPGDTGT